MLRVLDDYFSERSGGFKVKYLGEGPGGTSLKKTKTESLGTQYNGGCCLSKQAGHANDPRGTNWQHAAHRNYSEVWTSPDLQVTVMSKHSDPRFGNELIKLTGTSAPNRTFAVRDSSRLRSSKSMPGPMDSMRGLLRAILFRSVSSEPWPDWKVKAARSFGSAGTGPIYKYK